MTSLAQERKQCSIMQYCFFYIFIVTVCSSTGDFVFWNQTYLLNSLYTCIDKTKNEIKYVEKCAKYRQTS